MLQGRQESNEGAELTDGALPLQQRGAREVREVRDVTKREKFLARRWSSVCECVCLRGFVRLRALLVGPGVVVLSRSLAFLSVLV